MVKQEPKVAIVILNWNGFDDTVECLESLRKLDYSNYMIVLVDNGSEKEEGARLKEMFSEVYLITNETNRGFAGGNNDGINWALANGCEYVVSLNNDCVVSEEWLTALVGGLLSSEADFGASRIMWYDDRDIISSDMDVVFPDGSAVLLGRGKKYDGGEGIYGITSACGAGSIYSESCLKRVSIKSDQYYDELYFAYYEDVDLGIRLNALSFEGVYIPEAVLYHKHSKTAGAFSEFKLFQSEKNRMLTELLDFPIPLLLFGELFFIFKWTFKIAYRFLLPLFGGPKKGHGFIDNIGIAASIGSIIKPRKWILSNMREILQNRRERKRKGMINWGISRRFFWDTRRA